MKNEKMIMGILVSQVIMLLIIVIELNSVNSNLRSLGYAGAQADNVPSQIAEPIKNVPKTDTRLDMKLLSDDDPFKGDENAPVTIVEWSDFQCPFCARFYKDTMAQIEERYVKTGKVKIVYRDFPLSFHPFALKAAEAAECADEQGRFWDMHDKIFGNQGSLNEENLELWAQEIGLEYAKFNDCMDSGKMAAEVNKDLEDGSAAGIRGTPGFIINGKLVSGAQPFANFESIIEAELR
jgi:protein-disulfide isomerase